MFPVQSVHSLLVSLVSVLKLMQVILFLAGPVLLKRLDLIAKRLIVCDQLFLVSAVIVGVLPQLNSCPSDMDLELLTLVLGIPKKFLVDVHVGL